MSTETTVVMVGAIAFGIFALAVITYFHGHRKGNFNKDHYRKKWQDIEATTENEIGWTKAIIDADKLLDEILRKAGFKGKSMGERMTSASRSFSNCDRTWAAHKLRNRVVHETSIKLRKRHVQSALAAFNKALKDLGAI